MRVSTKTLALGLGPLLFLAMAGLGASCQGSESGAACQDGTIQLLRCDDHDGSVADTYSDEACTGFESALAQGRLQADDTQAPMILAPADGQVLPRATPFTFEWRANGLSLRAPRPTPWRAYTARDELARWSTLVPAAQAHCAPFDGVGFALTFRRAGGGDVVLRAQTAKSAYTPTAAAWAELVAAGGTLELRVAAARFSGDTVSEGPYEQTAPRRFSVAP